MKRTPQQQAFVAELLNGSTHIALQARAGTGKTTTIIEGVVDYAKQFPTHEITICAFGKAIAKEIDGKLKDRGLDDWRKYQAATSHSMGFGLVKFVFRNPEVNDYKVRNLIEGRNDPFYLEYAQHIANLVHYAKLDGFGFFDDAQIGDTAAWYALAEHYSINGFDDTSTMDDVITAAQHIYKASLAQTNVIDFDDQILFPLVKNLRVKFQRDLIIVDEAQDTSRARRALLRKFLKLSGRMIIVGDDRQSIMGFAGASADGMGDFITEMNAKVMPLTVTWRVPRSGVNLVKAIVPDYESAPEAIEGAVEQLDAFPAELLPTDSVLCRNTAPLIDTAYSFIRRGIACKVEGRELGTNLLALVNRWKRIKTIQPWLEKLEDWSEREVQKAMAKRKEAKVQEIQDRFETLRSIADAVKGKGDDSLDGVRAFINDLFADDVAKMGILTLCTYHRAKGREWPRVMLLEHTKRCPSKYAKQAWEKRQEENLAYVAQTRHKETIVFVDPAR